VDILKRWLAGRAKRRNAVALRTAELEGECSFLHGAIEEITRRQREEDLSVLKDRLAIELAAMVWMHELSCRFVRLDHLHPLLEELLNAAIEITGARMGHLQLFDEQAQVLTMEAHRGFSQEFLDFFSRVECRQAPYIERLCQRERVSIEDITQGADLLGQAALEIMLRAGVRAVESTPLFSREGRFVGVLSTHYDIPQCANERNVRLLDLLGRQAADLIERAQAELALRRSEERLRLAAEATGFGTFDVDLSSGEVFWSPQLKSMIGMPADYVPRFLTPCEELPPVHPDDHERVTSKLEAMRDPHGTGQIETEYRIQRPDGAERWVLVKGRTFFEGAGEARRPVRLAGTVIDVTQHKQAEEALIRSEKLAFAGRMAATVAHEINNPLAAITNVVFLVHADPSISANARAKLELAQRELERVASLTRQTLGFYRETASPAVLRLSEVVENAIEACAMQLTSKNIVLVRRYASHDYVFAVPGEIRQIVTNLLTNAMDAVSMGGRIIVKTARATSSRALGVRLVVADNGMGMSPAARVQAFEPFFTTKKSVGTGLGLWVTRELTAKARGEIQMRSRVGVGTVFTLRFPTSEAAPERSLEAA